MLWKIRHFWLIIVYIFSMERLLKEKKVYITNNKSEPH